MSVPLEVDVHEASRLHRSGGATIVDVREPVEIAACRLQGALEIPMREIPARLSELPVDRPLLVLCHHGGRSARVTLFLRQQGWEQVSNIAGGIDAWAREIDPALPRY